MRRLPTRLDGLVLLEPTVHGDERGFFVESYRENVWAEHGVPAGFVQDNHSRSGRGVVRGMHVSLGAGQAKLVRCARGRIWDVAVDLRRELADLRRVGGRRARRRDACASSTSRSASRTASACSATSPTSSTSARPTTTRPSSVASAGTTPTSRSPGPATSSTRCPSATRARPAAARARGRAAVRPRRRRYREPGTWGSGSRARIRRSSSTHATKTLHDPARARRTRSRSARCTRSRRAAHDRLEALRDVSFSVAPGEFFGIVGRNGSGKSTLLKCLAGIYARRRAATIHVDGRMSTFIELGVGFNPDLAARDNVILNGIMLGPVAGARRARASTR